MQNMSPLVKRVVLVLVLFGIIILLLSWRTLESCSAENSSTGVLLNEEEIQMTGNPPSEKNNHPSHAQKPIISPTLSSVLLPARTTSVLYVASSSLLSTPFSSPTPLPSVSTKKFLYLVQTESCVPKQLTLQKTVGNEAVCRCNVIVLSYKRNCTLPVPAKHMRYIKFDASFRKLSWGGGRNTLFEYSKKLKVKYDYYIFMDDDVNLTSRGKKAYNPWREFENFLLTVEPAVGIADGSKNQRIGRALKRRKALNCTLNYTAEYLPSPRFDACFNAFHHKAIKYLLPYITKYDKRSWWWASRSIEALSEIVFPGQVLIHVDVYAMNVKHRKYPRKSASDYDINSILREVEKRIPQQYRASHYLHEMRVNKQKHEDMSSSLCLPPADPHEIIVPYRQTL